jgi:hypothetical protein
MIPSSEYSERYNARRDSEFRAECEHLTRQAFTEGLERLCDSEQVRLYELWTMFPDLKQEFEALQGTVRFVKNRYTPVQERSDPDWQSLEERINARVLDNNSSQRSSATERTPLRLVRFISAQTQQRLVLVSRIAAVFVLGLLCGKFILPLMSNQGLQANTPNTSSNHIVQASTINADSHPEEMRRYLNDAHLLMLGVMAMNAECGVSNPHTLLSQRERCVELLARSSRVQAGLTTGEREHMAHVMSEIESALAELADVQPASCNAVKIRQLQKRTDYALCEVSTVLRDRAIQ